MTLSFVSTCAAAAFVLAIAAASPGRAEECDDILDALKAHAENLMKKEPKGAALCAAMGQLTGVMQSAGIVAAQCLEGDKKDKAVQDMKESSAAMEEGIAAQCK